MSGLELGATLFGTEAITLGAGLSGPVAAATSGVIGTGGALSLSGLGTLVTVGSQLMGGFAQGEAADYNAQAGNAAALATEDAAARNAFALERKNRIDAENLSKVQEQNKARRAVAWGKSGVQMAGSPIELEAGAAWQDALNLTQTEQTGAREVSNVYYDAAAKANKLRTQAALDSYMGGTYKAGGVLQAGGTLLTAGAKKYGGSIYGG